ncbi:uncharacterized protein LAESUDRAFT_728037 [Laetiporus sulphureus 93-53]|uniref:Protein-S-isoprenylcysteine O-methyltransferase n=1 Tax=Laetiporus sulphureus 93-53 TaxID=1314785 RepID=A0A165DCA2_9APHY|nr:uncharacterized protein LAESUDRAFT_728037 [Laetiporus sulphureus 93-53]KZT04545.1 hypothetical protein LAESUDRAFT_728037 [Laetiporus sulphureus 93-53]
MALLVKAFLILSAAFSAHTALTPPTPPPKKDEIRKDVSLGERFFGRIIRSITGLNKNLIWVMALCETAVILACENPSHPLARRVLNLLIFAPDSSIDKIGISPVFLVGWTLAIFSGYFRIQCFRALGRLFTYEITLRDNHQLITSGPYSIVRHPAYTSLMLGFLGIALCHGSSGSWFMECGLFNTLGGKLLGYGYLVSMVYGFVSMTLRTPLEDELLKKEFGAQWVQWSQRVPYRLLPGIY